MPVLNMRALPQPNPEKVSHALKTTCVAIAESYGCKPEQVWATWEEIKPGFFVEGANSVDQQPATTHPPIGELICFEGKSADVIEKVLIAAGTTLSRELNIPGNVFIVYREAKSGQVIAGKGIIRRGAR